MLVESPDDVDETVIVICFLYRVPFESHAWNTTLCEPEDRLIEVLIVFD